MSANSNENASNWRALPRWRVVMFGAAAALSVPLVIGALLWLPRDPGEPADPLFAAYPADELFHGTPRTPTLDGFGIPDAFKPFIVNESRDGPNFAGAYTVVPYLLANKVQTVLVISARTGAVHVAPPATNFTVKYRLDSRLLVYEANASKGHRRSAMYFVLRGGKILEVPRPPTPERSKVIVRGSGNRGGRTKD